MYFGDEAVFETWAHLDIVLLFYFFLILFTGLLFFLVALCYAILASDEDA